VVTVLFNLIVCSMVLEYYRVGGFSVVLRLMWAGRSCSVSAMCYFRCRKSVKGDDIDETFKFCKLAYIADLHKEGINIELFLVKYLTFSPIWN